MSDLSMTLGTSDRCVGNESDLYCSTIATLFHFGGEFVDVVLILSGEYAG